MPTLSSDEIEQIVQREKPGYHISTQARGSHSAAETDAAPLADVASHSDDTRYRRLIDKYLGSDAAEANDDDNDNDDEVRASAVSERDAPAGENSNADELIVAVEPDTAAHPWDRSARPKAVVISVKDKKIIGQQG
jgi:hypothetical protein